MPTKKEIRLINLHGLAKQYPNDRAFAKAVDIRSPGQLSSMLSGSRNFTRNMADQITTALNLEKGYFDHLHEPIDKLLDDAQDLINVLAAPYSVPHIYWSDIDAWLEFSRKKSAAGFSKAAAHLPAAFKSEQPGQAFYLRNESRALHPAVQEGDLLGIDTTRRDPQHNDFVLVRLADNSIKIRQYRFQPGNREPYLRGLQNEPKIRWCDEPEILGTVVHRCSELLEHA